MPASPDDLPSWLRRGADGCVVTVKAVPRSRQTRAVGTQDGALRVQIAAAPHKGQANAALCAYIADRAGVRANAAQVMRGSGGARKLVGVTGDPDALCGSLIRRISEDLGTLDRPDA